MLRPTAAPGGISAHGRNGFSAGTPCWTQLELALSPSAASRQTCRFCAQRPHSLSSKMRAQRMCRTRWGQPACDRASSMNVRKTVPAYARRTLPSVCETGGCNVRSLCEEASDECDNNVLTPRRAVWRHVAQQCGDSGNGAARSASALHLDALQQLRTNLCRLRCQVHGRKAERMSLDDDRLIDHRSDGRVQQQAACRV